MSNDNLAASNRMTLALAWLLGAWLFLTVAMAFVATRNFGIVGALPQETEVYDSIPDGEQRTQALRYVASEINRELFTVYNLVQVPMAALALLLLWRSPRRNRAALAALGACFLMCLLFAFWFTPHLVEQGRAIDFVSRIPEPPAEVKDFYRVHGINNILELLKITAILGVSAALIRRP